MKLERAKRHMTELGHAVQSFLLSNPYKFSGKQQTSSVIYTMDIVEPVPPEIPLIAGDVIQTLRSALDHLV
jgi:hypothetical protein